MTGTTTATCCGTSPSPNPHDDPKVQGDETADLGGYLLGGGLAEPRYDSTDGYEPHPLEEAYHSIEAPPILPECGLDATAVPPTTTPQPAAAARADHHGCACGRALSFPPSITTPCRRPRTTSISRRSPSPGLIDQLEYEQYSTEAAQWAVQNVDADWNEQAALSAGQYLDFQAFSEGGLRDQLDYEGFTPEQIDFAIAEMKAQGRL